jgi:hypothetical protein
MKHFGKDDEVGRRWKRSEVKIRLKFVLSPQQTMRYDMTAYIMPENSF